MADKKAEDNFKKIIEEQMILHSMANPTFEKHLKKEDKSIDGCVKYIYSAVKKSGRTGFTDSEVYNMAVHYFVEDDVNESSEAPAHMILNKDIKFTEDELDEMKKEAKERLIKKEMDKITKKSKKKSSVPKTSNNENTLF